MEYTVEEFEKKYGLNLVEMSMPLLKINDKTYIIQLMLKRYGDKYIGEQEYLWSKRKHVYSYEEWVSCVYYDDNIIGKDIPFVTNDDVRVVLVCYAEQFSHISDSLSSSLTSLSVSL